MIFYFSRHKFVRRREHLYYCGNEIKKTPTCRRRSTISRRPSHSSRRERTNQFDAVQCRRFIKRLPALQHLRHYPSMPHIDTFFLNNRCRRRNSIVRLRLLQPVRRLRRPIRDANPTPNSLSSIVLNSFLPFKRLRTLRHTARPPPQPTQQQMHCQHSQSTPFSVVATINTRTFGV